MWKANINLTSKLMYTPLYSRRSRHKEKEDEEKTGGTRITRFVFVPLSTACIRALLKTPSLHCTELSIFSPVVRITATLYRGNRNRHNQRRRPAVSRKQSGCYEPHKYLDSLTWHYARQPCNTKQRSNHFVGYKKKAV